MEPQKLNFNMKLGYNRVQTISLVPCVRPHHSNIHVHIDAQVQMLQWSTLLSCMGHDSHGLVTVYVAKCWEQGGKWSMHGICDWLRNSSSSSAIPIFLLLLPFITIKSKSKLFSAYLIPFISFSSSSSSFFSRFALRLTVFIWWLFGIVEPEHTALEPCYFGGVVLSSRALVKLMVRMHMHIHV